MIGATFCLKNGQTCVSETICNMSQYTHTKRVIWQEMYEGNGVEFCKKNWKPVWVKTNMTELK